MSMDPRRLDEQVRRLDGAAQFLGRKELHELPNILHDTEVVLDLAQGTYENGNGLLVATDRRVLFINRGILYGLKVEDFPLDKVSSIQYETGMLLGSITIFTSGNKAVVKNVQKDRARSFAEGVRSRISAMTKQPGPVAAQHETPIDALERLATLKERGLLSDDEFSIAKRKLLGI